MNVTFNEDPDYDYKSVSPETMEILPVAFSVEHKQMLSHLYAMINKRWLAIPADKEFEKLIISLRTAQANVFSLDKEQTSYIDLVDALSLSLKGYTIE